MSEPDLSEEFIDRLYEMAEGDLKTFDRYEVGQELGLDREQTDAVVEELYGKRQLQKIPGTKIVLTPPVKEVLESKKSIL
ncbi:MAG: hypothetical protein QOA19_02420 [Nitrososphaeraceae archaeon]|jgi:hypothetical protein|nr:hypothetical protein [Nitrososphaeraceae archaeon]MDW0170912.1 hypothetical protein [Nitrososphaeraceae archaeon]MDW0173691.1 hypothetical protein [Nitrososphaeraceae archaeon]MDW0176123.1 hypothetical protein [Nitrososphaeraceae archaeon]MDW0177900.1 hypothetical protein [Nitrososphaeraceae archaeon]